MLERPPLTSMMGPERALSICCGADNAQHAGQNAGQRHDVAAVERQIDHAPVVDQTGEHRADRIHQRRGAVHGNLRFDESRLRARAVHAQVLIDTEIDAGADLAPEAGGLEDDFIIAGRQREKVVEALAVRSRPCWWTAVPSCAR